MIKAVIFDLDNTLVDFMSMKRLAVGAAINSMIDAGLRLTPAEALARIDAIYKEKGIEFQNVFDQLLYDVFQKVDYKILSAGVIAYRRAREAALVPYPHVNLTLVALLKRGLKLAVASNSSHEHVDRHLTRLGLRAFFDLTGCREDVTAGKPAPSPAPPHPPAPACTSSSAP